MNDLAIKVEGLGKSYLVGHNTPSDSYVALRDVLVHNVRSVARKSLDMLAGRPLVHGDRIEEFWALRDVSFDVKQGERVGVVGRNGAGKSTLLKVLSRITEPTRGRVTIAGRVASLLEVGTGFHPELTGRENIYLNGAILGMSRGEVQRKFDEIVDFAEVEKFLDTPVKRYSSGMYVRLAFAVAAHLEPDILVVDEVLAVGDANFQRKSLRKLEDVSTRDGRTILFVSHNLGAMRDICSRAIWLDQGQIVQQGTASAILDRYLDSSESGELVVDATARFQIRRVVIRNRTREESRLIPAREPFTVEVHYFARERIQHPHFWIDIAGSYGRLFGASMLFDDLAPEFVEGAGVVSCTFNDVVLLPQSYHVTVRIRGGNGTEVLTPTLENAASFHVSGEAQDYGMQGLLANMIMDHDSPIVVDYAWVHPDGSVHLPPWSIDSSLDSKKRGQAK